MSRRITGRGRRWLRSGSIFVPAATWSYNAEAANVTKDGSNIVSQVDELITGTDDLVQGVAGRRPLWVDNGAPSGTKDIVRLAPDGANMKTLTRTPLAAPFGTDGYTLFLVFNRVQATTPNWNTWLYNTGAQRGGWSVQTSSGANGRRFEARTSAGVVNSCTYGNYTANTWECHCIRNYGGGNNDVDSTTWFRARVNGVNQTITGTPWFWIPTSHTVTVGQADATANNTLEIGVLRMYASYFSDAQCAAVEAELMSAYGIT